MHYCISDLHGCFDEFMDILKLINFNDEDVLYIIGDVIDRGKKSIELLQYIKAHKNIILLKGNHELMAIECLNSHDFDLSNNWKHNGGDTTFEQFMRLDANKRKELVDYLNKLENYLEVKINEREFLLVHGGIDTSNNLDISMREEYECLWYRGPFFQNNYQNKVIISGHIPTLLLVPYIEKAILMKDYDKRDYNLELLKEGIKKGNQSKIIAFPYRYFIDCGIVFGHHLGCLRLEDLKEYYI